MTLLLIEDNPGDVHIITELLQLSGDSFIVKTAGTIRAGLELLSDCDVVLLDLTLPDSHGLATFRAVQERCLKHDPTIPIVVVTGLDDEGTGQVAIREGAQDFLFKGQLSTEALVRSIKYSVERQRRITAETSLSMVIDMITEMRDEIAALRGQVAEATALFSKVNSASRTDQNSTSSTK